VRRLFQIGSSQCGEQELINGLRQLKVAAVGPVVADELRERDVRVDLMPESSFFMKPLVRELVKSLGPASRE